jgi:AP2-associated kinase
MRHRSVPIKDVCIPNSHLKFITDILKIYSNRTQSEDRRNQQLPSPEAQISSPPLIGLQKVAPVQKLQSIPDITPMRRGRPTVPAQQPPAAKPSPSPLRGATSDPFAALDSNNVDVRRAAADELAARFPSLDEFSLLHDRGQKFEFDQTTPSSDPLLSKRVTQALADDAFNVPATRVESAPQTKPPSVAASAGVSRSASIKKSHHFEGTKESLRTIHPTIVQPAPQRPGMVSTGIQTSPPPSPDPAVASQRSLDVNKRPIWRVPETANHHSRTMSQPRAFEKLQPSPSSLKPDSTLPTRPSLLDSARSRSHTSTLSIPKSPASSRPSLESQRPSALDLGIALDRSKSAQSHGRPTSIHVESNLDFLREREAAPGRNFDAPSLSRGPPPGVTADSDSEMDDKNITSNVGFLRAIENGESMQKKHHRSSSQTKHAKRSSLSSITSNTKNIVKGKFGDAFRKFESGSPTVAEGGRAELPLTPTEQLIDARGKALTPIAGSEATGETSDDERAIDETQDLPPEVRRELERRRLSQEERRVEAAAAEYRQRLAAEGKGKAGTTRASTIQNRVKNLLDESQKQAPSNRTAAGYGKYTDNGKLVPSQSQEQTGMKPPPAIAPKPIGITQQSSLQQRGPSSPAYGKAHLNTSSLPPTSSSAPPTGQRPTTNQTGPRPPPPSKPKALRTGGASDFSSAGKFSPVVGNMGAGQDKSLPPVGGTTGGMPGEGNEWDVDSFSKRYPSLSGLEMVETEIPTRGGGGPRGGIRDI